MKQNNLLIATALLALAGLWACGSENEREVSAFPDEAIAVRTLPISADAEELTIYASGLITTKSEAIYSYKIGGIVDRIYVQEGESFRKGQLLASLKLTEIEAGERQAELGLEKARRDYQRLANLYADSVATLEQLQNTKTALEIAEKQLESISFNKQYAYIYANNAGFVRRKLANEGEILSAGMPVLVINENRDDAWELKAGLSDKDWTFVEVGNPCLVTLDAYPGVPIRGRVFRKSQAADQGTGSFQVEISLELGQTNPAVGMFGKVQIQTNHSSQYISLPYEAIIEADGRRAYVFVPADSNRVRKLPITIERFDADLVQVRSGLEGVREVVLNNSAFLNEQSLIHIVK
jgi:RND family efflux transporter MFP subunit